MAIELDITNALKPLVENRVYPDVGPDKGPRPYITFQQVGGDSVTFLEGGPPVKRYGRFQINVWGNRRDEASDLGRQVEDTLLSLTALSPEPVGGLVAVHEPETKLYGTIQDFSFWY